MNPEAKVPPALETLLRKCLQRSPADRYQDCSQIKSDLEKIKSGKTVTIRLAASREELLRKSLVLAAVFIALAGVVGAVFRVPLLESVCFKLNAAGDAKFAEGKSQEAMNDFRQTIFFSQFLSSKNGTKLHAMRMLAALLKEQKLAAEAAVLEEKIRETIGDVSLYPDLIPVFRQCDFEIFNSRFDKAEPLARKAVAQSLRLAGKDSLSYAIGLDKLALCLAANGNFEDAIRLAEEALQISNTLLEPDDMFLARQMNNLAAILSEAGKPEQSNKLFNSARAIKMKNARGRLPWNIDLAPPRRPGS